MGQTVGTVVEPTVSGNATAMADNGDQSECPRIGKGGAKGWKISDHASHVDRAFAAIAPTEAQAVAG